jgi:hypothetical protein
MGAEPVEGAGSARYVLRMRGRKLWRGLRWNGVILLTGIGVLLILGIEIVAHDQFGIFSPPVIFGRLVVFAGLAFVPIAISWGRHRKSAETTPYDQVLDRLVRSDEEYCLILRPFGADGEVVLSKRWFGALTIEQVIARAARKSLGLTTYAIVDQDRRLAPPGPTYLRAPHDRWQAAVRTLVRRAHSIVVILPPGQDIRDSFKWEIDQLTHHGLQSRVIVVLPPDRLYKNDYPQAFQHACVLAATMEGFAGSIEDVLSLRVLDLEASLSERTHVVKYCRSNSGETPVLRWWYVKKRGRRHIAGVKFYVQALTAAFATTERELSSLGFPARYTWTLPS